MKPFIVLLSAFGISLVAIRCFIGAFDPPLAARIALAIFLLFTSIGHFLFTKGMALMVPTPLPFKKGIVYATGLLEIGCAVCLFIPALKQITGCILIALFLFMLPANIKAALEHLNYEKGTYDGKGPSYLWFRVPLQLFFIAWTYYCTLLF